MDFHKIDYHLSNTHNNKRFKSFRLDLLDNNYDSDTQTINNFDDEFSEMPNLNNNKKNNKNLQYKKAKYRNNSLDRKSVNKNLNDLMEINTDDKKAVLDILLRNNIIKKKKADDRELIKEKNRNRYFYIESKTKPSLITSPVNTYGRQGFHIEFEEGNPEFIKDMNYAKYKLKKKLRTENELVADLLFNGTNLSSNTHKSLSRKEIGEKIKKSLEKKRKNLEKIEWQLFEKEKLENTFTPSINHKKKDETRRNFDNFLKDQYEYQKKIRIKKGNLLAKSKSEEQLLFIGHPKINKNSELIAKKLDLDKNVYLRLYDKNTYDKQKYKKNENHLLELTTKNNTNNNSFNYKNSKLKKNKYSYIQSKINIWKNSKRDTKESNTSKKHFTQKSKSSNDLFFEKKTPFTLNDLATNRMLYNKFSKNFDAIIEDIFLQKNENGINGIDKSNIKNNNLDINENQYYELLYNLGMINYIKSEKDNYDFSKIDLRTSKSFTSNEKKLVKNSFNILKLKNNKIKVSNLKIFLCFVLNLHNYYFYHQYKLNHNPEELQQLYPLDKYKKEEIPLAMIQKYNEELLSIIDKSNINNTKYFYINKNNNNAIVLTLDNYNHIQKDFSLFKLNYRNHKIISIPKSILILQNSNSNFYSKIYPQLKEGFNTTTNLKRNNRSNINNKSNSKTKNKVKNIDYIDKLLLLEKRRKAKNEQRKKDLEKKEIKECTFKPKLITNIPSYIDKKKEKPDNILTNQNSKNFKFNRLNEMYEKGKNTIKARRDRTKIEIEIEEQISECTFQPKLYASDEQKNLKDNFKNDIYNEKQYKSMYERLKHGRLNQMIKDNTNDRYDLDNQLKKYIKDYKENNVLHSQAYYNQNDSYYNNHNIYIHENQTTEENVMDNCNLFIDINKENKKLTNNKDYKTKDKNIPIKENIINEKNDIEHSNSRNDIKSKDPLLIIDLEIKEGLSKKIYVYMGDTSKSIAKKLALEYNLDDETQNKLENIIHNQMVKPLTKIEEENFSGSEKN